MKVWKIIAAVIIVVSLAGIATSSVYGTFFKDDPPEVEESSADAPGGEAIIERLEALAMFQCIDAFLGSGADLISSEDFYMGCWYMYPETALRFIEVTAEAEEDRGDR